MVAILFAVCAALAQVEAIVIEQGGAGSDMVFIGSPGLPMVTARQLEHDAFADAGRLVVISYDCPLHDVESIRDGLAALDVGDAIVVAHGVGARLALQSGMRPRAWVLAGPVVDVVPVQTMLTLTTSEDVQERVRAAQELVGTAAFGCVSERFGDSLAADLSEPVHVSTPPSVALVSMGDDVAAVEAVVPVLARSADLTLVRVGLGGWGGRDLSHAELWTSDRGQRLIRRALRRLP